MIFRLRDMVGQSDCQSELRVERQGTIYVGWARAVPLPFYDGLLARIAAAWQVILGNAYPVQWPEAGELEEALTK